MRYGYVSTGWFQKVHKGLIVEGVVEPLRVVKHFVPFKDGNPGFGPRGELTAPLG